MRLLVGLGLDGPSFATLPSAASARLGEPAWGPTALLRDLELRLAVPDVSIPRSARVPQYAGRIRTLDDPDAFYRASFEVDPIGTGEPRSRVYVAPSPCCRHARRSRRR